MFISDKIAKRGAAGGPGRRGIQTDPDIRKAFIYLIISAAVAAFGAVYEYFSFGVYSYFMIYAFAFPLIGGTLPYMIRYFRKQRISGEENTDREGSNRQEAMRHAAVATLTTGSIMHGALEICGRPNSLTVVYLIAAVLFIAGWAITGIMGKTQIAESA